MEMLVAFAIVVFYTILKTTKIKKTPKSTFEIDENHIDFYKP